MGIDTTSISPSRFLFSSNIHTVHPLAFLWLIPLPPLSLSLSSSFLPILPLSSSLLCLSFFLPPFNRSFRSKELYCHTFSLSLLSLHFFHPFLCTSSVLSLKGEEVEETELEGIAADQQTHYCSNVIGNKILQVQIRAQLRSKRLQENSLVSSLHGSLERECGRYNYY